MGSRSKDKIACNGFRRRSMRYKIVLTYTNEGVSVSCPGLPGCWSQGRTESEAIENIKDAIQEYLAAIHEAVKEADVREVEIAV
jgi:predicted RNase H-like HicB family nuclease